ncbi:ANGT protein, partial [Atractosteus spatula]|nr:ANGT protein [Atractosteus spatula]
MQEILKALLLLSCACLTLGNRVYVHPFKLFALENLTCVNLQSHKEKLLEENLIEPSPIDPLNTFQGDSSPEERPDQTKQNLIQLKAEVLAGLQNGLGLRVYRTLLKQKTGNALFSPVNTFGTLVTFYLGASLPTAAKLQEFIGIVKEGNTKNCTFVFDGYKVLTTLQHISSLTDGTTDLQKTFAWTFVDRGVKLSQEFARGTRNFADSSYIRSVDFSSASEARPLMNSFIEQTSLGKIKNLFSAIDPSSDLMFASSVHFKGKWKVPFQPEQTTTEGFWIDKDTRVTVPLLSHTGSFKHKDVKGLNISVLQLPMSKSTYMLLVLPHEGADLHRIEERLFTGKRVEFSELDTGLTDGVFNVFLPKFFMSTVNDLQALLSDMNLPYVLGETADFRGLGKKQHFTVGKVLNGATLELSEEGSEAGEKSYNSTIVSPFRVDRPFFFAVIEGKTGAILLLGRITDPRH